MFRTEIDIQKSNLDLTHQDKVITIGSCFAEVIGSNLQHNKVDTLVNPFGTIFNPISVCLLLNVASGMPYDFEQHLVQRDGIWYAYDFHSSFSSPDKDLLLAQIQEKLQAANQYLQEASLLIITLGTAVAYKLNQGGDVVANCHKLPARYFNRELLNQSDIIQAFTEMYDNIRQINPKLKVLLTVSPVRHIKETLITNSVSKSMLRVICHQLQERHEDVLYFPAFEIMMDDLRDYRYYKDDLIHPTSMAENYIWQKFVNTYYNDAFLSFLKEWDKLSKALQHRPFHPGTESHRKFLLSTETLLKQVSQKYGIDVSSEINDLQEQLSTH
ncbi:GSCFA domain-containing protein [Pontibacter sp. MBLB2868]|uniref:GSCFA domain-containing protein n=1 Tax=Pontibacter sp. MBLB2868 TaxID=3451555 RepID=UPI003F74B34C